MPARLPRCSFPTLVSFEANSEPPASGLRDPNVTIMDENHVRLVAIQAHSVPSRPEEDAEDDVHFGPCQAKGNP